MDSNLLPMELNMMNSSQKVINRQFSLLTFNTFLRPPPVKNNEDDYKNERFVDILDAIQKFDIVCLQEVFQTINYRMEELILAAYNKQFHYWVKCQPPPFYSGPPVDSGLVILSKFPIVSSHFESYGFGILSDSSSDKGYIYAKIQVGNTFLHLFNTHLQASYNTQNLQSTQLSQLSMVTRIQQTKHLKRRIKQHLYANLYNGQKQMIILAGDFNVNALKQSIKLTPNSVIKTNNPNNYDEYKQIIKILQNEQKTILAEQYKIIDYLFERYQSHKPTYGTQSKMVLTHQSQHGAPQRLDYIVQIRQTKYNKNKGIKHKMQTCKVEQFEIESKPYVQLSDHCGVSADFSIQDE